MWKKQPDPIIIVFVSILMILALACRVPGMIPDEDVEGIQAPQEHISEEQLQETIKKTQEAYFAAGFNGEHSYTSQEIPSRFNNSACDFGFPRGSNVSIKQQFEASDSESDQVVLWIDGEPQTYYNSKNSYKFCRDLGTKQFEEGDEFYDELGSQNVYFRECVTFQHGGFELEVEYHHPTKGYRDCYTDKYTPAEESTPQFLAFDGQWTGEEECGDEFEFPYTWTVALTPDDSGNILGTIRFHKCGGGYVVYSVIGQAMPDQEYIELIGIKVSGAGDLFESSAPDEQEFIFTPGVVPSPNLGGR